MSNTILKLGTRSSDLALSQAAFVKALLEQKTSVDEIAIVSSLTEGDRRQDVSMTDLGGKGVFIKDLERLLVDRKVDFLVHSLKDVTSKLVDGMGLIGFFEGPSYQDCIVFSDAYRSFSELPQGARIGTSSKRRKVLLNQLRPDLICVDIRGNILTRLKKLKTMDLDGIVLSEAGLLRLSLTQFHYELFDPMIFVPAPGQGVLAIEAAINDEDLKQLFLPLFDPMRQFLSSLEMRLVSCVGLDCTVPFGCYMYQDQQWICCRVFLSDDDGCVLLDDHWRFLATDADVFIAQKQAELSALIQ